MKRKAYKKKKKYKLLKNLKMLYPYKANVKLYLSSISKTYQSSFYKNLFFINYTYVFINSLLLYFHTD
jgi:hypothetical protein